MQGTRVRTLVQEDPTCRGATKPVHPVCFHSRPRFPLPSLTQGTNNKELPLPTRTLLLLPTPQGSGSVFPLFTNYLWTVVWFFVQCFVLRHPTFLLLPVPNVHPHCVPQDALRGRGLGQSRLGYWLPQPQGRWSPAPRTLQQSKEGGLCWQSGVGATFSPVLSGRR